MAKKKKKAPAAWNINIKDIIGNSTFPQLCDILFL